MTVDNRFAMKERCFSLAAVSLCVLAAYGTSPTADGSFFGVDAASSWLARPGCLRMPAANGESHAYVVRRLAETGFVHARERLSWNEVNPAPGKWDFTHYLRVAHLCRERGVGVTFVFHDAPNWMEKRGKLPVDLAKLYSFCRLAGETFGDEVEAFEFWNEEDIGFCSASAWDYVAAAKAAYLGFKDAAPRRLALMGALCNNCSARNAYDRALFANGLGDYTDAFNLHTYTPLSSYRSVFEDVRELMATAGLAGRAVWVTESGTHQEGHSAQDGVMPGMKAHSPAQEALHAEIAAKSQFLLMMEGVSRDCFFCFPPYNEVGGCKDWGMMRRDGTLKPAAKTFADMIGALKTCSLRGEADVGSPNVRAYAFRQPDGRETLAYVAVGPADREANVRADGQAPDVPFAFRGRTLVASALPKYLPDQAELPLLRVARPVGRLGAPPPTADEDRRLVLQVVTDSDELALGGGKSALERKGPSARLRLVLYNFEGIDKTGSVTVTGGDVRGLPAQVAVPAWGKTELALVTTTRPEVAEERLDFGGVFGGRRISQLSVSMTNLEALKRSCDVVRIDCADASRWSRNDSASAYGTRTEADGTVRAFHLVWKGDADRWAYPRYQVGEGALRGAKMLEFEIRSEQDKVENDFVCANVFVYDAKGHARPVSFVAPLGNWETRRVDLSGVKDLDRVCSIAIGANPKGRDLTYFLRNVRLYRARENAPTAEPDKRAR